MTTIPEDFRDLLDRPILVSLATLLPDGQPQVTPVWCDYDGTYVRVNTAAGRQKARDMAARPQVTLLAVDPQNSMRYVEVRGNVVRITEEGADEHIDKLGREYTGHDRYPYRRAGEVRLLCLIAPERVLGHAG